MYDPANHYWIVGGDAARVYSSAAVTYVSSTDPTYTAWQRNGRQPTRILSEGELGDVLAAQFPAGWPAAANRAQALALLDRSDMVATRCTKAGVAFPAEWKAYVTALRAIVASGTLPNGGMPTQPAYPAGT